MGVPRICVLDGYTLNPGDNPWDELAELGELTVYDRSTAAQVVERAQHAEIVLTNKTVLDRAAIDQLASLQLIAVLATGYNVVDVDAAAARGVTVVNVPEYGTTSVAQHVMALLLELAQRVGHHDSAVHRGEWQRAADFSFWDRPPLELAGLRLGVVGYGRIGAKVGALARAFGMEVVAARSARANDTAESVPRLPLPELLRTSDVVTLHCPLTPDNQQLMNSERLALMKPSAFLINTARGGLVDEGALAAALRELRIAGAAVDVVAVEPMRADNPLLRAPNCIITPHLAWASLAARRRLMAATVANVSAFLSGHPINTVGAR